MSSRVQQLREQMLRLADEFYGEQFPERIFVAGESPVPVSGRVLNGLDLQALIDAALDCWLTTGRFAEEFERCFLMEESADCICLDIRAHSNAAPFVERFGKRWLNIPQETLNKRMDEVPRDKRLLLMCNAGGRSYEAMRQLDREGIDNTVNVEGGMAVLKKSGMLKATGGNEEK